MNDSVPTRRVQRVRHELRRREVTVRRVQPLSPHCVSVTLAGDSLRDFVSDSFDDHIKLLFADASGQEQRRDYTPRHFDRAAGELTLEFALHERGPASDWARQAQPGQTVAVGGPRGSMIIPADYPWHLLAGDLSALPALRRRVEELPAGTAVTVLAQAGAEDRVAVPASAAALQWHWVDPQDDLADRLRAMVPPPGEGFIWCAGEAAAMARVRDLLLDGWRHPREALRVSAYWKRGASDFHDTLHA